MKCRKTSGPRGQVSNKKLKNQAETQDNQSFALFQNYKKFVVRQDNKPKDIN